MTTAPLPPLGAADRSPRIADLEARLADAQKTKEVQAAHLMSQNKQIVALEDETRRLHEDVRSREREICHIKDELRSRADSALPQWAMALSLGLALGVSIGTAASIIAL